MSAFNQSNLSEKAYVSPLLPTNIVTVTVNDERIRDNASSCENSGTFNKAQAMISIPLVLFITLLFTFYTVSICECQLSCIIM